MAHTLTNLIPDMYEAADIVSREQVGMIPAVHRDTAAEQAAQDQVVRVPITQAISTASISPSVNAPDTGDLTVENASITITKVKGAYFRWNGKDTRGLQNTGQYEGIATGFIAQAMRGLLNEIETDLAALYTKFSRAYGTAGTTPFATAGEFDDASEVRRILRDNGAPNSDLQLVLGSAAIAKMLGYQTNLQRVNEAGTSAAFQQGVVPMIHGFTIRDSAQIQSHTKGTGTGYDSNGGSAGGDTSIPLDGGDSGTILAGDIATFAGDANKYVVASGGTATGAAAGNITLAKPGLRATLATTTEMTIGNSYTANLAFHRQAIVLVARAPELPEGGDAADDRVTIVDPVSGLPFTLARYRQHMQALYRVEMAWGVACIKPEHTAILLG